MGFLLMDLSKNLFGSKHPLVDPYTRSADDRGSLKGNPNHVYVEKNSVQEVSDNNKVAQNKDVSQAATKENPYQAIP